MVARRAHHRRGGPVKGYYNKWGTWIAPRYRGDADVSESTELQLERERQKRARLTGFSLPLAYSTRCWWCNDPVYFYRGDDGGCALFDSLGYPWPLHRCWREYREQSLTRVANELSSLRFDGRRYYQERLKLSKSIGEDSISITGFVDRHGSTSQLSFSSGRGSITSQFRELRIVPDTDPSVYYSLLVPTSCFDELPVYSLHKIEGRWKKHGGRWHCFLANFRRLHAGGRADKIICALVTELKNCFYCGSDLSDGTLWGFDTEFRAECRNCGLSRRRMIGNEYVAYITNCFNRIGNAT